MALVRYVKSVAVVLAPAPLTAHAPDHKGQRWGSRHVVVMLLLADARAAVVTALATVVPELDDGQTDLDDVDGAVRRPGVP